jgi:DNA (cytosine-5)-methyltransferase 1
MRFGSVCSGIEAASVAWKPLGWEAAWFSEIEPFPSAALNHHYPNVPNLGDMTLLPDRILSGEVEAPDVFCGGTPCQAFSVAGNRKSLDDARGNLSLTFCEIADAIDTIRQQRNQSPAIIFWENVPGCINTKDNFFGCFLAELSGETVPLQPSGGRWTDAGFVSGPKRTIAWRILDAQYFGLAQRRRRVFVVASARKGFNPSEVLFEFDSLRRDTAPSRQAGQSVAADAETGVITGGGIPEIAGTILARDFKGVNTFDMEEGKYALCFEPRSPDGHARVIGNIAPCLNTMGCGQREPCVTYGIPGNWIGRAPENGGNATTPMDNVAPCLTSADRHGVATVLTGSDQQVAVPLAFAQNQLGEVRASAEVFNTLNTNSNASGRNTAMVATQYAVRRLTPIECERLQGFPDNYTNIPWRKKPEAPDGPRYKALGNSWAVPVVRWIGERINNAVNRL